MAEEIVDGVIRVTTDTGTAIADVEKVVAAVEQELARLGAVQPRPIGQGITDGLGTTAQQVEALAVKINELRGVINNLGSGAGVGLTELQGQLRSLNEAASTLFRGTQSGSLVGGPASNVAALEAQAQRAVAERQAREAAQAGSAAQGGANGGIVPVSNQARVVQATEAVVAAEDALRQSLGLRAAVSGEVTVAEEALAKATAKAAQAAAAVARETEARTAGGGSSNLTDLNDRLQAKVVAAQERLAGTLEQEGVLESQIEAARREVLTAQQALSIETQRASIAQRQAARGLIFGGAGEGESGFKPNDANVQNAAAQERAATADPVRTASTRLAAAEENYAQVFERGFATQEAADLAGLRALTSLQSATDSLANARARAAKEEERAAAAAAAEANGQSQRAAALNNPTYRLLTEGSSADILGNAGADAAASARTQALQVERTRLAAAQRSNVSAATSAQTEEELARLLDQRRQIERRILANEQAQQRNAAQESADPVRRTGFVNGLTGSYGGNTEDGLGGISFQAGQAAKYFALYTVLSSIQGLFSSLRTEAEQYTIAVNDLSIALGVGKEAAGAYAVEYANVGATYAASPIESVQGATKFVRSFRQDDATGVNQGYSQEQIGSFGAELTSIIQQLEGKTQTGKVTQDLVGLSRAYGVGAAGTEGVYDQLTKVAQFYGFSTGGQISSGVAQIGDLAKSSGYDIPGAAALIASVQQATGVGSDQAAGDVKRFLGSQQSLDKVFEKFQIGGDLQFKDRLDKLIQVIGTQSPEVARQTLGSLGDPRIQAVVQALVSGSSDQAKAEKAAAGAEGTSAEQASKRITQSFGGAVDKLLTDFDRYKVAIIDSGIVDAAGVLVVALSGVLEGLTALASISQAIPGPINAVVAGILGLAVAQRALSAVGANLGSGGIGGAVRGAFQGEAGTNRAANASAASATSAATEAQATSAAAATTAAEALAAAQTIQAESAAAAVAAEEAQVAATTAVAAVTETTTAAQAAFVAVMEADAGVTAALTGDIELLAVSQSLAVEASAALTVAMDAQIAAELALVAANEALVASEVTAAGAAGGEAAAQEALAIAEATAAEAAVIETAALEAQVVATQEAIIATGGLGGAITGMGLSIARAIPGMLVLGSIIAGIAAIAAANDARGKLGENAKNVEAIGGATGDAISTQNLQSLSTQNEALKGERAKLNDNINSFGGQLLIRTQDAIHAGASGPNTSDQAAAALAAVDAKIKANDALIASYQATGSNVTKDSQLADFFGSGLNNPAQGIGRVINNRLDVGSSTSVIERYLASAPPGALDSFLNSGDTATPDATQLFTYLNQRAGRSTDPAQRGTDLDSIRKLALDQKAALTARGADGDQLSQAQEIVDQTTKAAFDQLLKNTASRVEQIKQLNGPTGKSNPAQVAQIQAIVKEAITTTTQSGDVDSTISLLAGVDQAFIVTFKNGLRAQIIALQQQAAALQEAAAAAAAVRSVIEVSTGIGDNIVPKNTANDAGAVRAAQTGIAAKESAQAKLEAQLKTLDKALTFAAPTGTDFKFPGDQAAKAGPTAQAIEEARIASQVTPADPLSQANVSLRLAQYKLKTAPDPVAYYTALKDLHQAQYDLAKVELDQANASDISGIDITDPVAQARQKVRAAQRQLSFDQSRGASSAVTQVDANSLRQASSDAQKASFDQQFGDYQTNYDLNRISLTSYLSYLNSQHDYLSSVGNKTRQQVDELNQVDRALKGLSDQLQGQFNLGDIKVPTPYEVRRALTAGSAANSGSTSYVTITVNGADVAAVKTMLTDYVGQGVTQTTGTLVRKN